MSGGGRRGSRSCQVSPCRSSNTKPRAHCHGGAAIAGPRGKVRLVSGGPAMSSPKFQNLVEMFERSVEKYGPRELFGTKVDGEWKWTTYREMGKLVADLRGGLAALGVKRGENVCIVSNNRVEWAALAYACFGLGVSIVPMYE